MPNKHKKNYIDILSTNQAVKCVDKKNVYRQNTPQRHPADQKYLKIHEAHNTFIKQSLDEWFELGIVKQANSL